ncbi:hypothetical protein SLNWT_4351 [Streptomyces albus]|uniref:Uncharacterized protein n=1 Tax=Streptomyces albus (strain ATCC 21838 / DSM 41398 / FERM P-419 / JCM 4703 / NBRC 107858) TaxID=1081613 RepID=A0A0B5F322_STRA4|nr:hypothetical protein SLNWT_4351 [Streptomyces albus]AOU79031.1 hypothetical protein SLNHY_4340 [Streptomyces albus]AYN34768.1 hypothetical protein DUI70_4269 [Streptomyces albus]
MLADGEVCATADSVAGGDQGVAGWAAWRGRPRGRGSAASPR